MSRLALSLLLLVLPACGPRPDFEDVRGLWGRVDDGEHQIWELAREIDATGLVDVLPAFRRWEYDLDSSPREMARGRWNLFGRELVFTPAWSLVSDPEQDPDVLLIENKTIILEIESFNPVELQILYPDEEEPRTYVSLERLPDDGPE